MSATTAPPLETPTLSEAEPPRVDRQLAILGQIAEIGLTIAQAIERQVQAPDQDARATASAAVAYGRVARAVRLTIALQTKLFADASAPAETDLDRQRAERRGRIARIAGRVAADELDLVSAVLSKSDIRERLEHDDIYGDLLARPASEIVAEVCEDLGISPDWARLATEAWAREEIAGGQPGAPLIPPYPARPPDNDLSDDPDDDDFDEDEADDP